MRQSIINLSNNAKLKTLDELFEAASNKKTIEGINLSSYVTIQSGVAYLSFLSKAKNLDVVNSDEFRKKLLTHLKKTLGTDVSIASDWQGAGLAFKLSTFNISDIINKLI